MRFETPLIEGKLIRRHKRYSADIQLPSGKTISAHLVHPGSLQGCCFPGSRVLVSALQDLRRRHSHQVEIAYAGRTAVGVHCGRPVNLLMESVVRKKIDALAGYAKIERIVETPRVGPTDVLLYGNGLRPCHVAVRNVTLAHDQVAYYPDSAQARDVGSFRELTDLVRKGRRALIFLVVARGDAEGFRPADHIDPEASGALRDAYARGVEVACWRARVTRRSIELERPLPVDFS